MLFDEKLRHIQDNVIGSLHINPSTFDDDDDLDEVGRAIMANTSIQKLSLGYFKDIVISKYRPLFLGISQNKSIPLISISYSDVDEELSLVKYLKAKFLPLRSNI